MGQSCAVDNVPIELRLRLSAALLDSTSAFLFCGRMTSIRRPQIVHATCAPRPSKRLSDAHYIHVCADRLTCLCLCVLLDKIREMHFCSYCSVRTRSMKPRENILTFPPQKVLLAFEYRHIYVCVVIPLWSAFILSLVVGFVVDTNKTINYTVKCRVFLFLHRDNFAKHMDFRCSQKITLFFPSKISTR